jgi:hypothetical protein
LLQNHNEQQAQLRVTRLQFLRRTMTVLGILEAA